MAGYNYYEGMSNNALDAYENGIKPLSKITALDLKLAGWTGTKADAMRLAKSEFWKSCEWHHSGGSWYNSVDFYNPADLVEYWDAASSAERVDALKTKEPIVEELQVRGEYTLWGGTRKRPRKIGSQPFVGTLKNNWIFLDDGTKKKASGNYITWEVV
tara:strand:- start:722 stop:1195 length:474 start_codon:yes stop_codon:yes gene_type:complete